ncbi:MAG: phosphoribosylglycinamide formyltransferase [Acidimicrobiales bacterium]
MSERLVVLASSAGSNLQAILDACSSGRVAGEVVQVVVNRAGAGARRRARNAGVAEIHRPLGPYRARHADDRAAREAYDADLADELEALRPDWVVLAGWMHLFTSSFLDRFPGRVVNLHPALPGEFPGAHAIDDAWTAHERRGLNRTGVMMHLVIGEGVDDGPVLATRAVAIDPSDTRDSLERRIHTVEHELVASVLADLCAGALP